MCGPFHTGLHHLSSERRPIISTQDPRATQMPVRLQGRRESLRKRHDPCATALCRRYMTIPLRVLNRELRSPQIDVRVSQGHHLATASARFTPEQDDLQGNGIEVTSRLDEQARGRMVNATSNITLSATSTHGYAPVR